MFLNRLFVALLVAITTFTACSSSQDQSGSTKNPDPLLLVSFDGFRYDYMDMYDTPNLDSLAADGVRAEGLIPVFPSKTFPNHYAIATGLYPEDNGFVGNTMYDPKFDAWYHISDRDAVEDARWYEGEPIWNTVEKQGLRAGTLFWVGSEAPIQNMRPSHYKLFDSSMPYKARIDTVVKWFKGGDSKPVDFATLYFSITDHYGHRFGPENDSTAWAVREADRTVGYLKKKMKAAGLWDKLNLMIVSDHGMTALDGKKVILLDKLIDLDDVKMVSRSPVAFIQPEEGKEDKVYQALKRQEDHYRVFRKEDLPERWHLKHHRRVTDIVVVADQPWTITSTEKVDDFRAKLPMGMHGYDNKNKQMHGYWVAHGPAFKNGYQVGRVQNVNLYPLMAHIMGLQPAPNDGALDSVKAVLK